MIELFSFIYLKALLKVHQNNISHSICVRHRRRPSHLSSGLVYQYILSLNKFFNLICRPIKTYHFYFSKQWKVAVLSVLDWSNNPHFGKKFQKFVQFQTGDDSHIVVVDSCYTRQEAERSSRRGIPYVMVLQQYMAKFILNLFFKSFGMASNQNDEKLPVLKIESWLVVVLSIVEISIPCPY